MLSSSSRLTCFFLLLIVFTASENLFGQDTLNILFVRGADRSGGATEGSGVSDPFNIRGFTEQLADIRDPAGPVFTNNPTGNGNHSWFELASLLNNNGFNVEQTTETVEAGAADSGPTDGAPVTFDTGFQTATFADLNANNGITQTRTLDDFDAVIFGSNNAVYNVSQIDAVDSYIRSGGGAIFISDANFGRVRGDAQRSDQQFLDRFGIQVNEDSGTYQLNRGDGASGFEEFRDPDSPLLEGVDTFDGEGVSPFTLPADPSDLPADVFAQVVAGVPNGQDVRGPGNDRRDSTPLDAALLLVEAGQGRIVGHFDRNTFFNQNGAGSDVRNFDNTQLALNIFSFAATVESCVLLGDVNLDGVVDFLDISPFILALSTGSVQAEADIDQNSVVDFLDIGPFILTLSDQ